MEFNISRTSAMIFMKKIVPTDKGFMIMALKLCEILECMQLKIMVMPFRARKVHPSLFANTLVTRFNSLVI